MLTSGRFIQRRWRLLLGLVPVVICLCLVTGCGVGDSTKPAGIDPAQQKNVQEHLGKGYRESLIAEAKSSAKAKAAEKDAAKTKR